MNIKLAAISVSVAFSTRPPESPPRPASFFQTLTKLFRFGQMPAWKVPANLHPLLQLLAQGAIRDWHLKTNTFTKGYENLEEPCQPSTPS
ncbi:MAG: hypothetical protein ABTQ26_01565 [Azonexus sp.]